MLLSSFFLLFHHSIIPFSSSLLLLSLLLHYSSYSRLLCFIYNSSIHFYTEGLPNDPNLRRFVWEIFLGFLPLETLRWKQYFSEKLIEYQQYREDAFKSHSEAVFFYFSPFCSYVFIYLLL